MSGVFSDRGHVLIAGITGSKDDCGGKTALANWWLDRWGTQKFDLAVFFNAKGTSSVKGRRVTSIDAMADAMADGARHINYVPQSADWEREHEHFKQFLQALPDDMSKIVVHDEAPELGAESLNYFVRVAGNGNACKSLVVAQAPGDLDTSIRRQCPSTIWIGPVSTQNKHWFRSNDYGAHYDHIQRNHSPYEWTLMEGPRDGDRTTYAPVPERYANV